MLIVLSSLLLNKQEKEIKKIILKMSIKNVHAKRIVL